MSSTFLTSYLHEVTSSLSNWHRDNYDVYRFGPQPQRSWKKLLSGYFRRRAWLLNDAYSDGVMAAVRLVEACLARFEWLYARLADDESREILIKVLAFRALGHRRVKLPLSTPAYWDELKQMERLMNPSDFIPITFLNWRLHRMDLGTIGVPVQLYFTPLGAHHLFVQEQYRCRSHIADIAVEPGDCVIDAGACWGDSALYFAHRSRPGGRVYSYEFIPDNLTILRRNLMLNPDLGDRIEVIERAAWGKSNLELSVQNEGPASRVSAGVPGAPGPGLLTLAIDDLAGQRNLPKIDFIKMDVEGAELQALRGAVQTMQRCKPKLAISVYHHLADFYEIPEFLDSLGLGYRYFLRHYTIHAEETVLFAEAKRGENV